MKKKEFKIKVVYGSWDELISYKNNGVIGEYSMVAEYSFPTLEDINAFILGTTDMGGYGKYKVVDIKYLGKDRVKIKVILGQEICGYFNRYNKINNDLGSVREYEFKTSHEYSAFITALNISTTYSYANVIESYVLEKEILTK